MQTQVANAAVAPSEKLLLTIVIPTLNEGAQMAELLATVQWADEVIVADGGSTDDTVAIAQQHGATVIEHAGETIAAQRNRAIGSARNEWVFALDADERISEALRAELGRVLVTRAHPAYRVRRRNFFLGRERRRGRWSRDWQVRLFTRERRFTIALVHEHLEQVPNPGTLSAVLHHAPYRNLRHQLDKMVVYAQWGAQELYRRGRPSTLWDLSVRPLWCFARDYFAYRSVLDGAFGLLTSVLTAYACFLKYAYLWELRRRPTHVPAAPTASFGPRRTP